MGEQRQQLDSQLTPQDFLDALPRFKRLFQHRLMLWRVVWLLCWASLVGGLVLLVMLYPSANLITACIISAVYLTVFSLYYSFGLWFFNSMYVSKHEALAEQRYNSLHLIRLILVENTKQIYHQSAFDILRKSFSNIDPFNLLAKKKDLKLPKYIAVTISVICAAGVVVVSLLSLIKHPEGVPVLVASVVIGIPFGLLSPIYSIISAYAFEKHARSDLDKLIRLSSVEYSAVIKQFTSADTLRKAHPQYVLYLMLLQAESRPESLQSRFPIGTALTLLAVLANLSTMSVTVTIWVFTAWFLLIVIYGLWTECFWKQVYSHYRQRLAKSELVHRIEGELSTKEHLEDYQPFLIRYSIYNQLQTLNKPRNLADHIWKAGTNLDWYFGLPRPLPLWPWWCRSLPWIVGSIGIVVLSWAFFTYTQQSQSQDLLAAFTLAGCATAFGLSRIPSLLFRHKRTAGLHALVHHLWECLDRVE
jgi:hypothetical protein